MVNQQVRLQFFDSLLNDKTDIPLNPVAYRLGKLNNSVYDFLGY